MKFKATLLKDLKTLKWQNFVLLTIAGVINSIGVCMFLAPVNLYDSGLSGTSLLLGALNTNFWHINFFSLSFFLILLNIPFFIIGFKKQGATFTIYSLYVIAVYSLCAFIIQNVLPINVVGSSPIAGSDFLLCAIFGGLLSGIGSGITIRFGGALDGVEVMAVIFAKYIGLTIGTFVMIYNCLLYVAAAVVFKSWEIPLYSIITYAIGIKAVDFVVEGLDKAKAAMIITNHAAEIAPELSKQLGRGITLIDAKGFYSKAEKTVLYCVVNRFQINKLKRIVLHQDENAFVTITDISDTLGTSLKFSLKKKHRGSLSGKAISSTFPTVTLPETAATQNDSHFNDFPPNNSEEDSPD